MHPPLDIKNAATALRLQAKKYSGGKSAKEGCEMGTNRTKNARLQCHDLGSGVGKLRLPFVSSNNLLAEGT